MYLSCQLFFETPHKTLKFQQKLLPLQEKNITKHDRMEVLSTDIQLSTMFKLCFCSQKECWKCIFWQLGVFNFKNFSFTVYPGNTSWRQWTKQTVKKLNLWKDNGCRKKWLDKSLDTWTEILDKDLQFALFLLCNKEDEHPSV